MVKVASAIPVLFLIIMTSYAQDYCKICENHTMCKYWWPGPLCARRTSWGVDGPTKNRILDIHNGYRRKVAKGQERRGAPGPQPPAANMNMLTWDDELARVAQRWADQCDFEHDKCRNVDRFYWVGQNLYISAEWRSDGIIPDNKQDWEAALGGFYDEVPDLHYKNVDKYNSIISKNKTGHYTQLVWGKTTLIGCGFSAFKQWKDGKDWFKKYYVCNYAPGGNVQGSKVYEKGKACSKCPSNARCDDGLCTTSRFSFLDNMLKNFLPNLYNLASG